MLDPTTKRKLTARLKRAEGQIAGLRRMLDEDANCVDVLLQISAAQGALGKAGQVLLAEHIRTCVADAFASGDEIDRDEKVDELMDVFARYGGLGR